MTPFSCENIIVDKCGDCGGIWFDKKELGIFRDSLKTLPIEELEIDEMHEPDTYAISSCPRCSILLHEEKHNYNSKIKVNKCPRCEGTWLQEAQLVKFIDLARIAKISQPDVDGYLSEWTKSFKEKREQEQKIRKPMVRFTSPGFIYFFRVIPLYDINPRNVKPWVTTFFIIFCSIMYYLTSPIENFLSLGLVPGQLVYSSFITSIFLHGNLLHLIGNMFFLWTFGDNVEETIGPVNYILFFIICGVTAGLAHVGLNSSSLIPAVGASGAISGIMGAYLYLFPHIKLKTWVAGFVVDLPVWAYLGFWFLIQVVSALISMNSDSSNKGIAFGAHVGGFITGYVFIWAYKKLKA